VASRANSSIFLQKRGLVSNNNTNLIALKNSKRANVLACKVFSGRQAHDQKQGSNTSTIEENPDIAVLNLLRFHGPEEEHDPDSVSAHDGFAHSSA
jgi:hypothetical protein